MINDDVIKINQLFHSVGVHKRNRASLLCCVLLALQETSGWKPSPDATTLIPDLNAKVEQILNSYGFSNFSRLLRIEPKSVPEGQSLLRAVMLLSNELEIINRRRDSVTSYDILGNFYKEFLSYSKDSKDVGMVFTPTHITEMAAEMLDVTNSDVVLDPACGTGGFLIAAIEHMRKTGGHFETGNIYGIEQDMAIAALASVNMILRGNGDSHIIEGDGTRHELGVRPTKSLMNPPFSLTDPAMYEHVFIDRALRDMCQGGLLFSIIPRAILNSADSRRGGAQWRQELLKRHSLKAVIQLPLSLFFPVAVGTYGMIVKAHEPHNANDPVVWAMLDDGIIRSKTQKQRAYETGNMGVVTQSVKDFITHDIRPMFVERQIDCQPIDAHASGFAPEHHIGMARMESIADVSKVSWSTQTGNAMIAQKQSDSDMRSKPTRAVRLNRLIGDYDKGRSGRSKELPEGYFPLVSCSEQNNGISDFVDKESCDIIYGANRITISSNGGCCYAAYHDYEFAANSDVWVVSLKPPLDNVETSMEVCAAINAESWRYDYSRKFNEHELTTLLIHLPTETAIPDSDDSLSSTLFEI